MNFKNQTVVVTGANKGIGAATALAFAEEGAKVVLNFFEISQKEKTEICDKLENLNSDYLIIEGDISNEETVQHLFQETFKRYQTVDILVNNAGICNQALAQNIANKQWDRMIDVNLKSVFLTTKHVLPTMIENKFGRIINFASQIGQKGGIEVSHYAASKAGVIGFTKSVAREVGQYGVTANCIAPGPIETQMIENFDTIWRDNKRAELIIPRFGTVNEIVPSVLFLASSPSGNIYTGQTLGPNSGDVTP